MNRKVTPEELSEKDGVHRMLTFYIEEPFTRLLMFNFSSGKFSPKY